MLNVKLLRPLLRAAWGPDTCDPHDLVNWWPGNPARGQCGTTALVVQDLLGGELILCEVHVDGAKIGHHWRLELTGYGYGHYVGTFDGRPAALHTGDNPGYKSLVGWLSDGVGIVALSNDDSVQWEDVLMHML
jgi:hypothetical protein